MLQTLHHVFKIHIPRDRNGRRQVPQCYESPLYPSPLDVSESIAKVRNKLEDVLQKLPRLEVSSAFLTSPAEIGAAGGPAFAQLDGSVLYSSGRRRRRTGGASYSFGYEALLIQTAEQEADARH